MVSKTIGVVIFIILSVKHVTNQNPRSHTNNDNLNLKISVNKQQNKCGNWRHVVSVETHKPYLDYDVQMEQKFTANGIVVQTIITEQENDGCLTDNRFSTPENDGYILYPNFGYYKKHPPTNWNNAKKICESEGAHMTVVESKEEAKLLLEILKPDPINGVQVCADSLWIGVSDLESDGIFKTIFGDPFESLGYTQWNDGEPNGGVYENCLSLHYTGDGINDCPCNIDSQFICKKEIKTDV